MTWSVGAHSQVSADKYLRSTRLGVAQYLLFVPERFLKVRTSSSLLLLQFFVWPRKKVFSLSFSLSLRCSRFSVLGSTTAPFAFSFLLPALLSRYNLLALSLEHTVKCIASFFLSFLFPPSFSFRSKSKQMWRYAHMLCLCLFFFVKNRQAE